MTRALIISAGFRETGSAGRELEKAILARRGATRLIGPNCLGVMIPAAGLNATIDRQEGVEHVIGQMLPDNYAMQRICKKLGFAMSYDRLGEVVEAKIKL